MCLFTLRFIVSKSFFFFNDTATTEIYTLSLHDALPILNREKKRPLDPRPAGLGKRNLRLSVARSEEHTSELQSRQYLVCRLLLEKKKSKIPPSPRPRTTTDNTELAALKDRAAGVRDLHR